MGKRRGAGDGSILERPDGRWEARLDLGWENGKRKRRSFYGKTRAGARDKLKAAMTTKERGLAIPGERLTVAAYLESWLADIRPPVVRASTWTSYESIVRHRLVPRLGKIGLAKLTPPAISAALRDMTDAGLTPRSVQYSRAVLRMALAHAQDQGLIVDNPAARTKAPKVAQHQIDPLTPDQIRRVLAQVSGDRLEALYVVALSTGMRQGEILGLTWPDVVLDDDGARIHVRRALQRIAGRYELVEPKTQRSVRTIELPAFAAAALARHLGLQAAERELLGIEDPDPDLVFTNRLGGPLDGMNVTHAWQRHLVAAGLPRQRFHDARHAAATTMYALGAGHRDVMEALGHSSITTTMNVYTHVLEERKRELAGRMDSLFGLPEPILTEELAR